MVWAPDYVTADELTGEILQIGVGVDDAWVDHCVAAASRTIDDHCNRQFGQVPAAVAADFPVSFRYERNRYVVPIHDLMTTDGLVIDVDGTAVTDGYVLEPADAAMRGEPWTRVALPVGACYPFVGVEPSVSVTGRWGWSAVPPTIEAATLLQAQRFYMRRGAWNGVAGSPDLGSELRLLSKADADVAVMLARYVRPRVAR